MPENKNEIKKKKTLSLKLGSKPIIAPKRNIEAGKTVIVEKKRFKRNSNNESDTQKIKLNESSHEDNQHKNKDTIIEKKNKSGVVLKPLSKDEQKKILKAENKNDKNREIEKIRQRDTNIGHEVKM